MNAARPRLCPPAAPPCRDLTAKAEWKVGFDNGYQGFEALWENFDEKGERVNRFLKAHTEYDCKEKVPEGVVCYGYEVYLHPKWRGRKNGSLASKLI